MNHSLINKIILFFIYISIFISSYVFTKEPAEIYFGYITFIALLPIFLLKFQMPRHWMFIAFVLLVTGLYNVYQGNDTVPLFIKIFLGLFFSYLFYYYVVVEIGYSIEELFNYYLKGCYIVALIGVIQFVSYQIHFSPGYDYSWLFNKWGIIAGGNLGIRVNSVFPEPTYFATCISGGMFVALYNLFSKQPYYLTRFQNSIIVIAYILSFSGVAFTGIFIAVVVLLLNFGFVRYVLFIGPMMLIGFFYLYNNVPDFRDRYDGTIDIFTTEKFQIGKTHGSSIILYDNYQVAMKNFKNHFLFGSGLGSHPIAYAKYSLTQNLGVAGISQNSLDASSMLSRLLSETGLFGAGLMLFIFFRCFVKRDSDPEFPKHFWLISGACAVLIALNLLRQGNYFLNGFPFFVWLYYYNKVEVRNYVPKEPLVTTTIAANQAK